MRTKTLLIAAAALAATVISSEAQVYSANIVGYVNQVLPGVTADYSVIVNPLVETTNSADTVLAGALTAGDQLFIWTGTTYFSTTFEGGPAGYLTPPNDWVDQNNNTTNGPNLYPAEGFFYLNNQGVDETNTFVGTVLLTNNVVLTGNPAYSVVGSTPPISGLLDSTNFNLPLDAGDQIFLWTGITYFSSTYEGGPDGYLTPPDDWVDQNNNTTNAPSVSVGQGFFYLNNQGHDEPWNQNLVIQ
jgi:hypothetical protein